MATRPQGRVFHIVGRSSDLRSRDMRRAIGATALLLITLTACSGTTDTDGDATTAEIHCETWVSQNLGIPTGDLQFDHRPTGADTAPSYTVLGMVVGGGQTLTYQCDTTFDGDETWTLDNLDLVDPATALVEPPPP